MVLQVGIRARIQQEAKNLQVVALCSHSKGRPALRILSEIKRASWNNLARVHMGTFSYDVSSLNDLSEMEDKRYCGCCKVCIPKSHLTSYKKSRCQSITQD